MDPVDRLSAEEALAHPYLTKFSDPSDEVRSAMRLLFSTV